jgi:hypothetical protein
VDAQAQQPSSEDELTESIVVLNAPSAKSSRVNINSTPIVLAGDDDLGPDDGDSYVTPSVRLSEAKENGARASSKTRRKPRTHETSLRTSTNALSNLRTPLGRLDPLSARNATFNEQTPVSSDGQKSESARPQVTLPVIHEDEHAIPDESSPIPGAAPATEMETAAFESTILEETSILDESSVQPGMHDTRVRQSETFAPDLEGTRTEATQTSHGVSNVAKSKPKARKKRDATKSNEHVEIKVYRRSKGQSTDADPLGAAPTQPVNSADVLAQFLSELCEGYIAKIKNRQSGSAPSKQLPRILMALTSFMTYCEDTLFEITVAQNAVHVLAARLNKLLKDQGGLRAELMNVKLEREAVRRKIDSVRARHSGQVEAEQAQNDLLTTLHDLDIAIQRGRANGGTAQDEPEEPSTLYDELQEAIQGNHILDGLRDWNSMLETSCQVLN